MRLHGCSLRRGTLGLGHAGKHSVTHHHLVLSGLLGVGHDEGDGADQAHATASGRDEREEDEGGEDSPDLTEDEVHHVLGGLRGVSRNVRDVDLESTSHVSLSLRDLAGHLSESNLLFKGKILDGISVEGGLTGGDGEEPVAEESSGTESGEGEVEEHAGGIEELGKSGGIAAASDAVANATDDPGDERTPEVDPKVGLDNDEDEKLHEVLEDETTEEASVEHVAATGAPPALASLFSHLIGGAFGTTLKLNILNLLDR